MTATNSAKPPRQLLEHLLELIDGFSGQRVAVIGDLIADEFIYGQLSRISREAPVLILKYDRTTILPGGVGNAASNVAAFGGVARLVARIGRRDTDRRLVRAFPKGVNLENLVRPLQYRVPVKTRILAGGLHSARQQIVRIDRELTAAPDPRTRAEFERAARRAVIGCDAVLISDYGSGLITPALVSSVKNVLTRTRRRRSVPILIDSRYDLLRYRSMTACTPNESEVEQMLGLSIGDDTRRLEHAGRMILKRTRARGVILTRGSRGMAVFVPRRRTVHIPIYGTDEVADVTGAGDTVIATLTLALAAGASFDEAARLANYAGGLVVTKRGTATVTAGELAKAIGSDFRVGG